MEKEFGERLKKVRADAGIQISELAARTRITARQIEALEEGRFDLLPGPFFVKGFIRSICAELGRSPEPFLEAFSALVDEEKAEEDSSSEGSGSKKTIPLLLTSAILLVLVLGGVWLFGTGEEKTPEEFSPKPVVSQPEEAPVQETPVVPDIPMEEPVQEPIVVPEVPVEEPVQELDLVIRAIERTWLRIQTDSSEPWEAILKTGDEINLKGTERISLFIGNAGGILFELNGRDFGPPGTSGQVISSYVITRDNL